MTTFEFQGRITENGKLEIELPQGLPAGEVTVRINIPDADDKDSANEPAWTEQELEQMMQRQPKTSAEIVAMLAQMPPIEFVDSEIKRY